LGKGSGIAHALAPGSDIGQGPASRAGPGPFLLAVLDPQAGSMMAALAVIAAVPAAIWGRNRAVWAAGVIHGGSPPPKIAAQVEHFPARPLNS